MEYISDVRHRETTLNLNDTLSVTYNVSQPTGHAVSHISAVIFQKSQRVGTINVDIASNCGYINFEKFSSLNHEDRKTALSIISDHIEAILTEPIEEPQA